MRCEAIAFWKTKHFSVRICVAYARVRDEFDFANTAIRGLMEREVTTQLSPDGFLPYEVRGNHVSLF